MAEILEWLGGCRQGDFQENYRQVIADAVGEGNLEREPIWTASVAVGSESFVHEIEAQTRNRRKMYTEEARQGVWTVREAQIAYS